MDEIDEAREEDQARALLRGGASIGQVLRALDHKMSVMRLLMRLAPVGLIEARSMAMAFDDGEADYEHMRLADLEYLARIIERGRTSLLASHLIDAIQRGEGQRWFARGEGHWRMTFSASESEERGATSATLEELRAALADPVWRDDVRVVRDEPDLVVLEFPRVTRR